MSFLFPFFCKIKEQEGGTVSCLVGRRSWPPVWGREEVTKGYKRVNVVLTLCILCILECKLKKKPVETISQVGGRGDKREWWKVEFKYGMFDIV
jgi:hypothetical protein